MQINKVVCLEVWAVFITQVTVVFSSTTTCEA